jgi:hypothetical protein
MLFVTVADAGGLAEGTLFTGAYRAWGAAARATVVRLEGRVEEALDAVTLDIERVVALDAPPSAPARAAATGGAQAGPNAPARVKGDSWIRPSGTKVDGAPDEIHS